MLESRKIYNPQISSQSYVILKRLSWLNGKPMTKTLDSIISQALLQVKQEQVCIACDGRGTDCKSCPVGKC